MPKQFYALVCVLILVQAAFLSGCHSIHKGIGLQNKKVYLGAASIENSASYANYLQGSKSEHGKLYYLLDRVKESPNLDYYYKGNRYGWVEAHLAGSWILWRHYKRREGARAFLRREVSRYRNPTQTAYIRFPDGSKHLAHDILLNELDLLEYTFQKEPLPKVPVLLDRKPSAIQSLSSHALSGGFLSPLQLSSRSASFLYKPAER
ncbi:MAG: hypothetical protein HY584_06135 [Candidatus Omnitrophica bacterium]|nr:hypothetical protein [Candidatus Omnitrophota bacterium]